MLHHPVVDLCNGTTMELSGKNYLAHLAEVNVQNKIVLSEDIFNQNGVLVVKKGVELNRSLTYKVAKHKLAKPIDDSIALTNSLSYKKLLETFAQRLKSLGVFDLVKDTDYFLDAIQAFKFLGKYPSIVQKLSIFEHQMPAVFARSLTTSSLAVGLCKELGLSKEATEHVVLANMLSDIGLLHIDPRIVEKKGKYSAGEWKMMQGHVAIAKHVADQVQNLHGQVGRALLEHHERVDGFGYPFGKKTTELCIEGQILAIVDKVNGLVQKLIHDNSYSWNSILHVMQIRSTAHLPEINDALIRVLRTFSFPYAPAFAGHQYHIIITDCINQRKRLQLWFTEFAKIYVNHEELLTDSEEFKPLALLKNLEHTIANTGVLNESQHVWLTTLKNTLLPEDYSDLEEFSLLLGEIEYRCFFVIRQLESSKDQLAKRFGGLDLLTTYHQGLTNILRKE